MINLKWFGREPAWWLNLAGLVVVLIGTLVPAFGAVQQGWFNGVVAAIVGVLIAVSTRDGVVAAVVGVVKAVIVVVSGYGFLPVVHTLSGNQQLAVYAVLSFVAAAYVRTQVTAPVAGPQVVGVAHTGVVIADRAVR